MFHFNYDPPPYIDAWIVTVKNSRRAPYISIEHNYELGKIDKILRPFLQVRK